MTSIERVKDNLGEGPFRTYSMEEIWERNFKDPNFLFYLNRDVNRAEFLRKGKRMQDQYLGACLDYVRAGAINACFWNIGQGGIKGLMGFIQQWMSLNEGNLIWGDMPLPTIWELPYINHEICPRTKNSDSPQHKGTIVDGAGRLRCAHLDNKLLKPSFTNHSDYFDKHAMMTEREFYEFSPQAPPVIDNEDDDGIGADPEDDWDYQRYLKEKERFDNEEPVNIPHPCYAIISEPKNRPMPLEKILSRLNIYEMPNASHVGFPFCGWTLAGFVQKWHEQVPGGKAPLLNQPGEKDSYRLWPDFRIMSSDD